jgi:hypothetical protein
LAILDRMYSQEPAGVGALVSPVAMASPAEKLAYGGVDGLPMSSW